MFAVELCVVLFVVQIRLVGLQLQIDHVIMLNPNRGRERDRDLPGPAAHVEIVSGVDIKVHVAARVVSVHMLRAIPTSRRPWRWATAALTSLAPDFRPPVIYDHAVAYGDHTGGYGQCGNDLFHFVTSLNAADVQVRLQMGKNYSRNNLPKDEGLSQTGAVYHAWNVIFVRSCKEPSRYRVWVWLQLVRASTRSASLEYL